MIRAAVLLLVLVVGACGPAPAQDAPLVRSSDPELRRRVESLLPGLAQRAGLELRQPVRVERRSREQLEGYLRFKLDEELPPRLADHVTTSYALLGMLPGGTDLRGVLLSVYLEQVAGFYDPDSSALFVVDDQPVDALEPVLLHELVHAVQDQGADLDSLTDRSRGNDRQTAAQAAIEGQATLVMLEYTASRLGGRDLDLAEVPDFSKTLGPALRSMSSQYPALASAPPLLRESLLFPYVQGTEFVQALWRSRQGRPPPFGDELPQSTEQVIRPERFLGPRPDAPTPMRVRPTGAEVLYENDLGELELEIFLQEHLGAEARRLARGWDGDAFVLVQAPDGSRALAWASVWDDAESRDAFVTAVTKALDDFPRAATLSPLSLEERPAALLRVGDPGPVTVVLGRGPGEG